MLLISRNTLIDYFDETKLLADRVNRGKWPGK